MTTRRIALVVVAIPVVLASMGCRTRVVYVREARTPTKLVEGKTPAAPGRKAIPTAAPKKAVGYTVPPSPDCRNLPADYGYVRSKPIEPGFLGYSNKHGIRWRCPSGVIVHTGRRGSVGSAKYHTKSPKVGMGLDVLDAYPVTCPNLGTRRVYVNVHRKGSGCPPRPFTRIPRQAFSLRSKAITAVGRRRCGKALKLIVRALKLSGPVDKFLHTKGIVLIACGRTREAISTLKHAVSLNPRAGPYLRLHLGMALQKAGRVDEYSRILALLFRRVSPRHRLYPELTCRMALDLRRRKILPRAKKLAAKSCRQGMTACCWKKP